MIEAPSALLHLFAPWQRFYADSKTAETSVTFLHLAAMMFGGGFAIAADRRTLRARPRLDGFQDALAELHGVHRPVLIALGVLFVSGLALATADLETFLASPIFLLKLGIVAMLLLNGGFLVQTEQALRRLSPAGPTPTVQRLWRRLRAVSWASLALWTASVLVGTMLVNA